MRTSDEPRNAHSVLDLRTHWSRSQSLASISEVEETPISDHDLPPSSPSTQPSSDALYLLSSVATTPEVITDDEADGYPDPEKFHSALCSKLSRRTLSASTNSSDSSSLYFSPNSDLDTPLISRLKLKRPPTSSPDKENVHSVKRPRLILRASENILKRTWTSRDDDENYDISAKKHKASRPARTASLRRADSLKSQTELAADLQAQCISSVPVIAPPLDYAAPKPLTARSRLSAYIHRERTWREPFHFERIPGNDLGGWDQHIGIGPRVRKSILEWISRVSLDDKDIQDDFSVALADQLEDPETRFHAGYLFLAFAFKISWTSWNVWDLATAAVAVASKFHHDFLEPMVPIVAEDLMRLPPQAISRSDLEHSQRLLLGTLKYDIGGTITPGRILDELWEATPGARDLFDETDWKEVLQETWRMLLVLVVEPDILQFPLTLLTVSVVVDASETILSWRCGAADLDELEGMVYDLEALFDIKDASLVSCRKWVNEVIDAAEGR
ncbi:hypothetical protein CYLTODRAFT_494739 [Cylindrobasidium torrendii FP15055 ss-10]|uniref:Uncharacterized protein n=1 Tax=Cylindrobasidium torrendii FP15055 ss-10 TaxID=1314674 RepID=A0A0D7AV87_9AGAR|nr:hypothetical protein CYLTODRAFT_494739 [Cylindrobasidium torrendii FP15055 ss-10]